MSGGVKAAGQNYTQPAESNRLDVENSVRPHIHAQLRPDLNYWLTARQSLHALGEPRRRAGGREDYGYFSILQLGRAF